MSVESWEQRPEVIAERLRTVMGDVRDLRDWRGVHQRETDVSHTEFRNKIESVEDAVKVIATELRGVKTIMTRLLFTIAASSITFAFAVLVATGKI